MSDRNEKFRRDDYMDDRKPPAIEKTTDGSRRWADADANRYHRTIGTGTISYSSQTHLRDSVGSKQVRTSQRHAGYPVNAADHTRKTDDDRPSSHHQSDPRYFIPNTPRRGEQWVEYFKPAHENIQRSAPSQRDGMDRGHPRHPREYWPEDEHRQRKFSDHMHPHSSVGEREAYREARHPANSSQPSHLAGQGGTQQLRSPRESDARYFISNTEYSPRRGEQWGEYFKPAHENIHRFAPSQRGGMDRGHPRHRREDGPRDEHHQPKVWDAPWSNSSRVNSHISVPQTSGGNHKRPREDTHQMPMGSGKKRKAPRRSQSNYNDLREGQSCQQSYSYSMAPPHQRGHRRSQSTKRRASDSVESINQQSRTSATDQDFAIYDVLHKAIDERGDVRMPFRDSLGVASVAGTQTAQTHNNHSAPENSQIKVDGGTAIGRFLYSPEGANTWNAPASLGDRRVPRESAHSANRRQEGGPHSPRAYSQSLNPLTSERDLQGPRRMPMVDEEGTEIRRDSRSNDNREGGNFYHPDPSPYTTSQQREDEGSSRRVG